MGVAVEVGDGLGGGVSMEGNEQLKLQLVPKRRGKTRIKQAIKYFRFIPFIAILL
jgi:hypothetical protein